MEMIERALKEGRNTLSEFESKQVLTAHGIPVTKEILVNDLKGFMDATRKIGCPLVLKGCSSDIAHKTEKGLIKVDILIKVGRIGLENETVKEIDSNPVIISGNKPVAVDALVVLDEQKGRWSRSLGLKSRSPSRSGR